MTTRTMQVLAILLSTFAGFVDAQGYLALGNMYVAFMSGNSTILGIAVIEQVPARVALSGALVACFVAGVMVGTWVGRPLGMRRPPVVLLLTGGMLAASALLFDEGLTVLCCLLAAAAMGAENTVFQKDGVSGIGLTYMTGTLVRLGQKLAEAVGGAAWGAAMPDLLLWLGMVGGAVSGAATYRGVGLDGLWVAVALSPAMAGLAWWGSRGR